MIKVLVTGGAGRIGINVCKHFIKAGYNVRLFDLENKRNRKSVKELGGRVELCWGDITDAASVRRAAEGINATVHMAAILPPVACEKPDLATKVNVGGTKILADLIKEQNKKIPFVFTSSAAAFGPTPDANEPLCPDRTACNPKSMYGETKLQAENVIKQSGIDYAILRLSVNMYFSFHFSDLRRMFTVPLNNRAEFCHPDNTAIALVNAVRDFDNIKNDTYIVSGGPKERMLYRDMIAAILRVMGLPLPPARKFTTEPYYLDWYDTSKSEAKLKYQVKTFKDYSDDYTRELRRRFTPLFLPLMRYFVSPIFGRLIVNLM